MILTRFNFALFSVALLLFSFEKSIFGTSHGIKRAVFFPSSMAEWKRIIVILYIHIFSLSPIKMMFSLFCFHFFLSLNNEWIECRLKMKKSRLSQCHFPIEILFLFFYVLKGIHRAGSKQHTKQKAIVIPFVSLCIIICICVILFVNVQARRISFFLLEKRKNSDVNVRFKIQTR